MSYKIKVREVTLEVDTPEELGKALRELGVVSSGIEHALRVRVGRKLPDIAEHSLLVRTLESLRNAGADGLSSPELMRVLEISDPKALGSKMRRFRNIIASLGQDSAGLVELKRIHGNVKRWYAGPRIEDALKRLK